MRKLTGSKSLIECLPSRKFVLGSFIVWTLFGLMVSTFSYAISENRNEISMSIWLAYLYSLIYFDIWALLTGIVFTVVKYRGVEEIRQLLLSVFVHVPIGILASITQTFSYFSLIWLIRYLFYGIETTYAENLRNTFSIGNTLIGLLIYSLTVIAVQSILFYQNFQLEGAKNSKLEAELSKAQMQALKMQLQPHFLFNTLHSISALNISDPLRANEMIARLGEFLRMTLESSDRQMVSLDEELGFIRHYLEIEQIRFSDRLEIEVNVDDDLLSIEVPHLILQPLVENAIKHGIAPYEDNGKVKIDAEKSGNFLIIKVINSASESETKRVSDPDHNNGKGLQNVRDRLKQIYEKEYECRLISSPDGNGHTALLKMPFEIN